MSYSYNQFTVELTLQHMAMVRLIQHFCRQPDYAREVSNIMIHQHRQEDPMNPSDFDEKSVKVADTIVSSKLSKLNLPDVMRKDLEGYGKSMIGFMCMWLRSIRYEMLSREDENWIEKTNHFAENPEWDNFGCVDGRRMLETYVDVKKTIDFDTWNQLCVYCSEDYIRRFFGEFSYEDCETAKSGVAMFWYHRIHGTVYIDKWAAKCFLHGRIYRGNFSAVKYFWNFLEDNDRKHIFTEDFLGRTLFSCHGQDVFMYLVGQMTDEQWRNNVKEECSERITQFLMSWPWIICIDSWRKLFDGLENYEAPWMKLYGNYGDNWEDIWRILLMNFKALEKEAANSKGVLYNRHRQIFEELWECSLKFPVQKMFRERDGIFICWRILCLEDIELCKLVFGGESELRRKLLRNIANHLWLVEMGNLDEDFWKTFMQEVLIDDDEREFFVELFNENDGKEFAHSDCKTIWDSGEHYIKFIL